MASTATVFGNAEQILSTWPAGVAYNPFEDKYTYSVSNSWKVQPLDHVHVVAIDLTAAPPYTMTLQLPIMNQLPFSSRFYYFYVSQSNVNDILTFVPTTGSGDTVNGDAVSASFTLIGKKQLFIAIGINHNYIIHPFGNLSSPAQNPLLQFNVIANGSGAMLTAPTPSWLAITNATGYTNRGWQTTPDPVVYRPGMDGYITVGTGPTGYTTTNGFICNRAGFYRVTYMCSGLLMGSANAITDSYLVGFGGGIVQVSSAAALVDYINFPSNCPTNSGLTGFFMNGEGTKVMHLNVGDFVYGYIYLPNALGVITQYNIVSPNRPDYSKWQFELIHEDGTAGDAVGDALPPPEAFALALGGGGGGEPGFFSAVSASTPAPPEAPVVVEDSPMHAQISTTQVRAIQKKKHQESQSRQQQQQQQQGGGGSGGFLPPVGPPAFSLKDFEGIVNAAVASQVNALREATLASMQPPPEKKRKRAPQQGVDPNGEKEIL